jgi:hypothetical protein
VSLQSQFEPGDWRRGHFDYFDYHGRFGRDPVNLDTVRQAAAKQVKSVAATYFSGFVPYFACVPFVFEIFGALGLRRDGERRKAARCDEADDECSDLGIHFASPPLGIGGGASRGRTVPFVTRLTQHVCT